MGRRGVGRLRLCFGFLLRGSMECDLRVSAKMKKHRVVSRVGQLARKTLALPPLSLPPPVSVLPAVVGARVRGKTRDAMGTDKSPSCAHRGDDGSAALTTGR
jgi:hypothetical protein